MADNLTILPSFLSSLGFSNGFQDILAFISDYPVYNINNTQLTINQINKDYIIPVSNIDYNIEQQITSDVKLAGAGVESINFSIYPAHIKINFTLPLLSPVYGWIDPSFANLWKYTYLAFWGSPLFIYCDMKNASYGESQFQTTNIEDMVNLPFPVTAYIEDGNNSETITISGINYSTNTINCSSLQYNHSTDSAICLIKYLKNSSSETLVDPTFGILSFLYGLSCPCLVNKLTIQTNIEGNVSVNIEIVCPTVYAEKQKDAYSLYSQIVSKNANKSISRMVMTNEIKVSEVNSNSVIYNMPLFQKIPYMNGFQSNSIYNNSIEGLSFTIDNQLEPIYASRSFSGALHQRFLENSTPSGFYSKGRIISGDFVFKQPLGAIAFTQKINMSQLILDFKSFKISMDKILWKPGATKQDLDGVNRTISWSMLSNLYGSQMPSLQNSYIG